MMQLPLSMIVIALIMPCCTGYTGNAPIVYKTVQSDTIKYNLIAARVREKHKELSFNKRFTTKQEGRALYGVIDRDLHPKRSIFEIFVRNVRKEYRWNRFKEVSLPESFNLMINKLKSLEFQLPGISIGVKTTGAVQYDEITPMEELSIEGSKPIIDGLDHQWQLSELPTMYEAVDDDDYSGVLMDITRQSIENEIIKELHGNGMDGNRLLLQEIQRLYRHYKKCRLADLEFGYRNIHCEGDKRSNHMIWKLTTLLQPPKRNKADLIDLTQCNEFNLRQWIAIVNTAVQTCEPTNTDSISTFQKAVDDFLTNISGHNLSRIDICSDGSAVVMSEGKYVISAGVVMRAIGQQQQADDNEQIIDQLDIRITYNDVYMDNPVTAEILGALANMLLATQVSCILQAQPWCQLHQSCDSRAILRLLRLIRNEYKYKEEISIYGSFKEYVMKLMSQLSQKMTLPSQQLEIDWIFGHPELRLMNTTEWSSADRLSYETDMLSKLSFHPTESLVNITAPVVSVDMKELFQIVQLALT